MSDWERKWIRDIPDRIRDGYGLNRLLIDRAISDGVDTVITCDNGIAAKEEIAYGKKLGLTVVVTDHHEVPFTEVEGEKQYQLPPADAVIDPKRVDCPYPFDGLCGAGVAYKLVEALTEAMGEDLDGSGCDLMENVAIATIGDVMDLVDENRIFVRQGLEMLKRTKNLGLRALMECTNIPKDGINPYHIGIQNRGPRCKCKRAPGYGKACSGASGSKGVKRSHGAGRGSESFKRQSERADRKRRQRGNGSVLKHRN